MFSRGTAANSTQLLTDVRLRKFGREVLHAYQAGMSVTSGRVKSETLDAFYKAYPIMQHVEFEDIARADNTPESKYTKIPVKDRLLLTGWKSLQSIRRIDQDIEAHISFGSEYQKAVAMAAARKKDQTVFSGMVGSALELTGTDNAGAMSTTGIPLSSATGGTNYYAFDSALTGADIYEALTIIKREFRKNHVGYNGEVIYVTLTPQLEYLLRNNEKFINTDYNDRKPSAGLSMGTEFSWNGFQFVETDIDLLPSSGNFAHGVKFGVDSTAIKGLLRSSTASGSAAKASTTAFRDVIMWTSRSVISGTHSYGFRSMVYREPSRRNSPAIQHDFFIGATRLLEAGVAVLRFK